MNWRTTKIEQLYKVSTPCLDDHNSKKEEELVIQLCCYELLAGDTNVYSKCFKS